MLFHLKWEIISSIDNFKNFKNYVVTCNMIKNYVDNKELLLNNCYNGFYFVKTQTQNLSLNFFTYKFKMSCYLNLYHNKRTISLFINQRRYGYFLGHHMMEHLIQFKTTDKSNVFSFYIKEFDKYIYDKHFKTKYKKEINISFHEIKKIIKDLFLIIKNKNYISYSCIEVYFKDKLKI